MYSAAHLLYCLGIPRTAWKLTQLFFRKNLEKLLIADISTVQAFQILSRNKPDSVGCISGQNLTVITKGGEFYSL